MNESVFWGVVYAIYWHLKLAVIIKFIAYNILVVERYFNFFRFSSFDFQDLCLVAVLVAIVRRSSSAVGYFRITRTS